MVRSPKKLENAFSLVEILVVVSIILLLTGFSVANYNNFNQENLLKKEVNKFIDVLSLVKTKAVTADINFDCKVEFSIDEEFAGYQVGVNTSGYDFKQCCRDVATKAISNCGLPIQSYNFPANISEIFGTTSVIFYPLPSGASIATITIKNSSINKCIDISITANGVITAGDQTICS